MNCETQREADEMWSKLSADGREVPCGWLKDRYGLSWQVFPVAFIEMLQDPAPAKTDRVMRAVLGMKRLIIEEFQRAFDGR